MSPEKAFYYFVAISGYAADDAIKLYGKSFDASNYERAMADEFERNRYRERIRARIADEVRKIDFSEKFTFVAQARLGEYSFGSHSFPIVWLGEWLRICIGAQSYTGDCTFLEASGFRVQDAVNGNDFNWSLPMSESDANAFVKSRSTARPGEVDRRITVRITYSVVNKRPAFSPFIYSVEAYSDQSLTGRLGVIPKTNSVGASTAEELRLATVAAQTATKEIGKYRYITGFQKEGYFNPNFPYFGTITLTDIGITICVEQPDGRCEMRGRFRFFDSPSATLYRANNKTFPPSHMAEKDLFVVVWAKTSSEAFETQQERDRFFVDLTHTFQEWKTKYAPFQFAAGKLTIEQRCEVGGRFVPCSETTLSDGKPVWQTPTYRVTVESLERNAKDYVATLEFKNLTDKTIKIAWQEKSGLVPDATGPYLTDESGEKYFAKGTDSGNILQDTMKYLWVALPEILPQAKLKSRFLFSGNGDGKMFTLKAKEMLQDLGTRLVTIDGLKVTSRSEVTYPPGTSGSGSSAGAPVTAPTATTSKTDDIYALGATQGTSVKSVQLVFAGKEDFESGGSRFTRYKFRVSNRSDFPDAMFEPAPDLPPCGQNANASRSWVDLFTRDGRRLNGFCALRSSDGLKQLWFALAQEAAPPDLVYIVINDRKLNRQLKSNLVSTKGP